MTQKRSAHGGMTILVIDTETTGLFPRGCVTGADGRIDIRNSTDWECCRMVQIAWQKHNDDGTLINKDCYIIKPDGYSIPKIAADIHGITTFKAIQTGIPIKKVFDKLADALQDVTVLVAHNMKFDDAVVRSELYRYSSLDPTMETDSGKHKIIDILNTWTVLQKECTMMMASANAPGKKWMKLIELYKQCFNREPTQVLHRADADVDVCADVYFYMKMNEPAKVGQKRKSEAVRGGN